MDKLDTKGQKGGKEYKAQQDDKETRASMARMGGAAESAKVDHVGQKGNMELTALKDSRFFRRRRYFILGTKW